MTRNLKTLGLALLAVFAMSAVAASGAQAEGEFTADEYPASVHAEQVAAEATDEAPRTFGGLATCGPGSGSMTYTGNTAAAGENEVEEAIGVRLSD